jgi:hypothetical protein
VEVIDIPNGVPRSFDTLSPLAYTTPSKLVQPGHGVLASFQ